VVTGVAYKVGVELYPPQLLFVRNGNQGTTTKGYVNSGARSPRERPEEELQTQPPQKGYALIYIGRLYLG
jgi:hypothetical protein